MKIRAPRCADVKSVLSCFDWSPEGGLSTPRYLKEARVEIPVTGRNEISVTGTKLDGIEILVTGTERDGNDIPT